MVSKTNMPASSLSAARERPAYVAVLGIGTVIVLGLFAQDTFAYFMIAIPVVVPLLLWLRGRTGVPVLSVVSAPFFVYYAMPLLRSDMARFSSEELAGAAAACGAFLLAASAASWPFVRGSVRSGISAHNLIRKPEVFRLIFVGLGCGLVYHIALSSGSLNWLGSSAGLVRSIMLTFATVACYLLGYARGAGLISGAHWTFAIVILGFLIAIESSSLFLVGAAMHALTAVCGYVIAAKRIPWGTLAVALAILTVLHAAKGQMRSKYWIMGTQSVAQQSVLQIPILLADWFSEGIVSLASGQTSESAIFERASLLHMVLLVQRTTPDLIPYLEGETYAQLPNMLVPRFVDETKMISQAGLNLLSVRYGLQSVQATASTTIGWGLVAEGFANYGYLGIILVGLVFGLLCGALTRLSTGAAPLSTRMLVTVAATSVLLNQEAVFAYMMTTLFQSVTSVFILATGANVLRRRRHMRERLHLARGASPVKHGALPRSDMLRS
jgi:hypothetical protein